METKIKPKRITDFKNDLVFIGSMDQKSTKDHS